jgi:hypothetical protein
MSKHEIDIMWQKAMCQSIEDGEMFTRYHFAKLVAERALADSMQEVQRLGQEIEQEPPQRTWVDIDVDDIDAIQVKVLKGGLGFELTNFARAIEAKLKQKNGYAKEKNT